MLKSLKKVDKTIDNVENVPTFVSSKRAKDYKNITQAFGCTHDECRLPKVVETITFTYYSFRGLK